MNFWNKLFVNPRVEESNESFQRIRWNIPRVKQAGSIVSRHPIEPLQFPRAFKFPLERSGSVAYLPIVSSNRKSEGNANGSRRKFVENFPNENFSAASRSPCRDTTNFQITLRSLRSVNWNSLAMLPLTTKSPSGIIRRIRLSLVSVQIRNSHRSKSSEFSWVRPFGKQ